jgi:hypothetical protein
MLYYGYDLDGASWNPGAPSRVKRSGNKQNMSTAVLALDRRRRRTARRVGVDRGSPTGAPRGRHYVPAGCWKGRRTYVSLKSY